MLAFKVEVDGEHVALAGFQDWSVLGLHIAAGRGGLTPGEHLDLFVGGLSERDALGVAYHVRWRGRDLTVGSRVTVSIVDTGHPDPPVKRYRSDKEVQESSFTEEELKEMRRQDYLELKKEFDDGSG